MYVIDNQIADNGRANDKSSDIQPNLIHKVLLDGEDGISTHVHSVSFILMMNHEGAYVN